MRIDRCALLVALISIAGCRTPLKGWKVSAVSTGCEAHRGLVITDASGQLREFEHPSEFAAGWTETNMDVGTLQIDRGDGGWWVANKGVMSYERGLYHSGGLFWLADGATEFESIGHGHYVGVFERDGQTYAVRRDCDIGNRSPWIAFAVLERIERGAAPVEVQRWGGLCPSHAIADPDGRLLLVALVPLAFENELFRVEGDALRSLAVIAAEDVFRLPDQIEWTPSGDLLLSTGWWRWADGAREESEENIEAMPRARVLRRIDDDHYAVGHLVRACRATPLPKRARPRSPERELGLRTETNHDRSAIYLAVYPDYPDLRRIVEHARGLEGLVWLVFEGVGLRDQADELLRLPANVQLVLDQAVTADELARIQAARPDLFGEGNWSKPR